MVIDSDEPKQSIRDFADHTVAVCTLNLYARTDQRHDSTVMIPDSPYIPDQHRAAPRNGGVHRILLLEDDHLDAELIRESLLKSGMQHESRHVDNKIDFISELTSFSPDLILADFDLNSFTGLEALRLTRETNKDVAFIIVTGSIDEETAVECMKAGIDDYVTKEQLVRLAPAIQSALEKRSAKAERVAIETQQREREQVFRLISENVSDLIAVLDLHGRRLYNSPSYASILGDPEKLKGTDSFRDIHPDDRERIRRIFQQTVRTGVGQRAEYRFLRKDGTLRYIESQGNVISDAHGNASKVVVVSRDVTERRQREEALRRSEARFRSLIENSSDAIALIDQNGKVLYAGPSTERVIGYSSEELVERSGFELVHPDDTAQLRQRVSEVVLNPGGFVSARCRVKHKNGSWIWIEAFGRNLISEPTVEAIVLNYRDITDRKKFEEALLQSEERYRAFMEQSTEGIWRFEFTEPMPVSLTEDEQIEFFYRHGVLAECNHAMAQMYGFPGPEDILGKSLGEFLIPEIHENIEHLRAFIRSGYRLLDAESQEQHSTGGVKYFLNNLIGMVHNGMLLRVWGTQRDVSERRMTEEALLTSEERYRRFFEDDLTGNYITTPEGRILACNPAFLRIFGFGSVKEARDSNISIIYPEPKERESFIHLVTTRKRLEYHEGRLSRLDGTPVHVVENAIGEFNEQGELVRIRGYLFDDTKRKRLEDQLLHSQKMDAVGQLASGIAHDFNNVMGVTLTAAQVIKGRSSDEEIRHYAHMIEGSTLRGAAIAKQLLQFSRAEAPKLAPVSLSRLVTDVSRILAHSFPKTINIEVMINVQHGVIMGDEGQIHQVLLNLCINARDALTSNEERSPHGKLTIHLQSESAGSVRNKFGSKTTQDYVVLRVSDTGCGMSDEVRRRMFDPFFTTKGIGKGTGLGLSIVHGIVTSHGGFIDVETQPGRGTTFSIYLPALKHALQSETVEEVAPRGGNNETILVIEDEEALRILVRDVLVRAGYRVLEATDGEEGLAMFQREKDNIRLILSDMGLPKLSGEQVFRELKTCDPTVKIILSTGFIQEDTKEDLLNAGAIDIVQKPYNVVDLLKSVRKALDA